MGVSSILSHSSNSPSAAVARNQRRPGGPPDWNDDLHATHGPIRLPAFQDQEWSPTDLVHHILDVHHPSVRQSMANLSSLAEGMFVASTTRHGAWENIFEQFSLLRADLLAGIQFEESEILPQLVPWAAPFQKQISRGELRALVKAVERLHARCLQMIWRLLRLTHDEKSLRPGDRLVRQFCDQLATLCEDYEQHLLEVDCLLLPGVTPCETGSIATSIRPQSLPVAKVFLASCEHHFRYAKRS